MSVINEKQIDQWINEHRDEMVSELKAWVSHPSVSRADLAQPGAPYGPACRDMLDFALERAASCGFETEDYDGYCGAVLSGSGDEEIGFLCHLDVVPEGENWIYAPYAPVEDRGFLFGRGVSDNKGAGVLCLFLLRFLRDSGVTLKHRLRLILGCAEETGMADLSHYVNEIKGPVPEVSIVADAAFPVCYAQKGGIDASFKIPAGKNLAGFSAGLVRNAVPDEAVMLISGITEAKAREYLGGLPNVSLSTSGDGTLKLTASGKAGHAAFPIPGEYSNAIVNAAAAAAVLEEKAGLDLHGTAFIAQAFASPFGEGLEIAGEDEESGRLTLNIGVARLEQGELNLEIDIRYPVKADSGQILAKLEEAAKQAGGKVARCSVAKPYYISPEDPKVTALLSAYRAITGDDAQPYSMGGGTYSRVFPNAISFGPGFGKGSHRPDFLPEGHGSAHGPDEALFIEDWLKGFRIYILSVLKLDEV